MDALPITQRTGPNPNGAYRTDVGGAILHKRDNVVPVSALIAIGALLPSRNETTLHGKALPPKITRALHSSLLFKPTSVRFLLVLYVLPCPDSEITIVQTDVKKTEPELLLLLLSIGTTYLRSNALPFQILGFNTDDVRFFQLLGEIERLSLLHLVCRRILVSTRDSTLRC